jgi:hypothetical protein
VDIALEVESILRWPPRVYAIDSVRACLAFRTLVGADF